MQPPVTQEEKDRREATDNRIRYIGDVMSQLNDIEDKETKLKIYKALLSSSVNNAEVIQYIDEYIATLKKPEKGKDLTSSTDEATSPSEDLTEMPLSEPAFSGKPPMEGFTSDMNKTILNEKEDKEIDSYLPTPEELELNLTDIKD